jgi:hypothetical protein
MVLSLSDFFLQLSPETPAFVATIFIGGVKAARAILVFFSKDLNPKRLGALHVLLPAL